MTTLTNLDDAKAAAARGALFVVSHSGGKDSQAQMIKVLEIVPASQVVVVHADLAEVEWAGTREHAEAQAKAAGVPFVAAKAHTKAGDDLTFLGMAARRHAQRPEVPSWPSSSTRQCTSDLKRGPIAREVRAYAKANGYTEIVMVEGLRAAESPKRAKLDAWTKDARNSTGGRTWWVWLPIHQMTTAEVFATIKAAGQEPHWAYAVGNDRLSCTFCIMGSRGDAQRGAIYNPALFAAYVEMERRTGYTAHMSRKSIEEVAGMTVAQAQAANADIKAGRRPGLPVIQDEPARDIPPCMGR